MNATKVISTAPMMFVLFVCRAAKSAADKEKVKVEAASAL